MHILNQQTGKPASNIEVKLEKLENTKWTEINADKTNHEKNSLSERLYRAQGINTQKLLGHKSQKMTDKYNDDRGKEWQIIAI